MAVPTTRAEFKDWCFRKLGHPVLKVEVTDEQAYDRIDEALRFWMDYSYDGSEKTYYKYAVTEEDKTNRYITLPENIVGAVSVFDTTSYRSSDTLFNVRWQLAMNDLYALSGIDLVPFYTAMYHLTVVEQVLIGQKPIRYNRHMDRVYVDMDWQAIPTGEYIVIEAYQVIDPTDYPDVWSDFWLQKYAVALIKQQWGGHLSKFQDMPLPGDIKFNGQKIYDDATAEIAVLEERLIRSMSNLVMPMIG